MNQQAYDRFMESADHELTLHRPVCDELTMEHNLERLLISKLDLIRKQIVHGRKNFNREPVRIMVPSRFGPITPSEGTTPALYLGLPVHAYTGFVADYVNEHNLVFVDFGSFSPATNDNFVDSYLDSAVTHNE